MVRVSFSLMDDVGVCFSFLHTLSGMVGITYGCTCSELLNLWSMCTGNYFQSMQDNNNNKPVYFLPTKVRLHFYCASENVGSLFY